MYVRAIGALKMKTTHSLLKIEYHVLPIHPVCS